MFKRIFLPSAVALSLFASHLPAAADNRTLVEFPGMMRDHMLANMRDHLAAINEILGPLGRDEHEQAADVPESRHGFSALEAHGAAHMAQFIPEAMREAGTAMHRAASQFARTAQEGEVLPAYRKLTEVTASCVTCHASFKVH